MVTTAPVIIHATWALAFSLPFDFTDALLTGQTVASVAATHVPPSGNAVTVTVSHTPGESDGAITVPTLTVTGRHEIRLVATLASPASNAAISIPVDVRA